MTSNPTPPTTCQRCGASLTAGTSFCPRCGTGIPVHRPWSGPTLATPSGAILEPRPEASEAQLAEVIFVAMAMASGAAWSHGGLMLQCQDEAHRPSA